MILKRNEATPRRGLGSWKVRAIASFECTTEMPVESTSKRRYARRSTPTVSSPSPEGRGGQGVRTARVAKDLLWDLVLSFLDYDFWSGRRCEFPYRLASLRLYPHLRAHMAVLPLLTALLLTQSAPTDTLPFHRGEWAAQFAGGGNFSSLGFLKFRAPKKALVVDSSEEGRVGNG